jgi:predicted ester cyclase
MTSEEWKARVRHAIDEIAKGNVDALDEFTAPDFVLHQPPGPDLKGLEAYKQLFRDQLKAYSDFQFTFDEFIREGELDAMRFTIRGTHTGQIPNMPIPPTGKRVTITGLMMGRTANGKAVEGWNYMDTLGLMQQLGVAPSK